MSKAGRHTEYREEYAEQAKIACEEGGFTDHKLARLFGVCRSTIANWKKDHPEFKEAVQEGKDAFDSAVAENSLLKRVKGFRYTEVTREPGGKEGDMVVTKKVSKMVAPDTKAILAFLYNRNRERWSNRQDLAVSGHLTVERSVYPWQGDHEDKAPS
ncbi:MAG: hypothetical protein ACLFUL_06350 [Desulfobacteraceae bacterium]